VRRASLGAAILLAAGLAGPSAAQGPMQPPMDPRAMSGVPRVDPQTEPGTLVVRVLRGTFQEPGVGLTVTLELKSQDGGKLERRTAVSVEQGRAVFADLGAYAGGTAIASVDFEGDEREVVTSQPVTLDPNVGVRLLLVKGASPPGAAAATPTRPPGDVPMPGTAFSNPGQPVGTVVVGTLDLSGGRPFAGVEVTLEISAPDLPVDRRKAPSDARGAARFVGLETLPAGTKLVAEATLNGELKRSEPFTLDGQEAGMAVVLAVASGGGDGEAVAPQRRPLQTPRGVPTIPAGQVRATIFDANDAPAAGVDVSVIKLDVTGTRQSYAGQAGPDGVARVDAIDLADDSLYQVEVVYSGAPFRSRLFQMNDRMGVTLELRVFPTTSDIGKVRSAVQFGVEALENDQARVVQLYQAVVEGEEAFWPSSPLRLSGPAEATGMVVLDRASAGLDHKEGAPFATLSEPLPPGELIDMSIAYLIPHRGTLPIRWSAPFPVANGRVVAMPEVKLRKGAISGPTRPPAQEGHGPVEFDLYEVGPLAVGASYDLELEGLVTTPRTFRHLGLGLGVLIGLGTLIGLILSPRASLQQRLRRRRDNLLRRLDVAEAGLAAGSAGASEDRQRLIAALDQVYRQLDVFTPGTGSKLDVGAAWDRKA
jgi:hypothetical protein